VPVGYDLVAGQAYLGKTGLLAPFLELELDTMVVMRTAPTQIWGNPVEMVMPVLNLGM